METITTADGTPFLQIRYEPENGWIRCVWTGNVSIEDISRGSARYGEILKEIGCPKLINDNSAFEANWVALNDELEKGRLAESAKNGLRYVAHVHSRKFITRFSAVDLGTRVRDFEFRTFEHLEDAEQWLRSIKNV